MLQCVSVLSDRRAGTLSSHLYQREIQPGEPVSLERSDLERKSVYDSPSSDEESADEETACDVGEIPSLERETNFLLRRVSQPGRSIRFNNS